MSIKIRFLFSMLILSLFSTSHYAAGTIGIIVNKDLYPHIKPSIDLYIGDIKKIEGKDAWLCATSFTDIDDKKALRDSLRYHYTNNDLEGAVMVGDLPICEFIEEDREYSDKTRSPRWDIFPCDLYYMDLTGTFTPEENPTSHTGDKDAEIWVTRLVTSVLTYTANLTEPEILERYFDRAHLRMYGQDKQARKYLLAGMYGEWPSLENENKPYLGYNSGNTQTFRTYSDSTDSVFTKKWANALISGKEYAYIYSHAGGLPYRHKVGYYIYNIYDDATNCRFYNVYCCQNARFTGENMCGAYATEDQGLVSVGAAKSGSMRPGSYRPYNESLGDGKSFGEAFKYWFNREGLSSLHWHYGMIMQGVGTLRLQPYSPPSDNKAPTALSLSNQSIDENAGDNVFIGTFSTIDPDAGQNHTYSLIYGEGDTDNSKFTVRNDSLFALSSFDYEQQSTCSIRIRTKDNGTGTLWFDKPFPIAVNNINEAPTAFTLSGQSLNENAGARAPVGTFTTSDPEPDQTHIYTLVAGAGDSDNASFSIKGDTLLAISSFDFETKSSYSIRIRSTDNGVGNLWLENSITISVTNVNEAPTALILSEGSINENSGAGATIGSFSTTDPDTGQTFTYSFVTGIGSEDNASFSLKKDTLQTVASFDFESKSSYTIRVRTTDNLDPVQSLEKVFIILVKNVNEAPNTLTLTGKAVDENAAAGTIVGIIASIDPDTGQEHIFSLVGGAGDSDNKGFTVVGDTLKTVSSFDFEIKSSLSIRLRSSDNGVPSRFVDTVYIVSVIDINEAPTALALSGHSIIENAGANAIVGNFSTTDQDTGQAHSYTLVSGTGGADNTSFFITGNILQAVTSFDYESKSSYNIRVRSTDNGNGNLYFEQTFIVTVTDANEAPTALSLSGKRVNENAGPNAPVGSFLTIDPDTGQIYTYSLIAGTGDSDNASFKINDGTLLAIASFDYEIKNSYSIRVRSTDNASPAFSIEEIFSISVNDINEGPGTLTLTNQSIAENAGLNVPVGKLSALDPDVGQICTYSFAVGAGSADNASFIITGNTLFAKNSFDFETKNSYSVRIRATDNGAGNLWCENSFTVAITNVNEAPENIALDNLTVMEKKKGAAIGAVTATDPDIGDSHVFTVDDARFEIASQMLKLKDDIQLTYDSLQPTIPVVTITVTDAGGLRAVKGFQIQVIKDTTTFTINFKAGPNPVMRFHKVIFTFDAEKVIFAELKIFDVVGNLVYEFPNGSAQNGTLYWNLVNKQDRKIGSGTYVALLRVTNTDGKNQEFKTFIGVKDNIY